MKRTSAFIIFSSLALAVVLIIQVNWILETAKAKEKLFSEKANMVLARTTEALLADEGTVTRMQGCMGEEDNRTIDSLFSHYMNFYNFHVDYRYEVVQPSVGPYADAKAQSKVLADQACYQKSLNEVAEKSGLELKLVFPEKKQFIMAEMGTLFLTSVILIIIVMILFWRTSSSLIREKKLAEHTTDFLNNMTHEFKTPLTNIALAGKMIRKDPVIKDDKIRHYTGIILEENEKLKQQVEQVLSMTALEREEIPLHKTDVDLHALIVDAVKSMTLQIESKGGRMITELTAAHPVISGDKFHLLNAFYNLIDNGIKYSGGLPDLRLSTLNKDQMLYILISDKGIGIGKEYQEKIFEKFFRVPTGDQHDVKGFGLGLAYVKKIIELHGGSIGLFSERGETVFTIILPYV